jgi:hypothetical protein
VADIPLLSPETRWECPNCPAQHVTRVAAPSLPFHECPGLRGMLAPYVEAGTRCKVEAVAREDYAGPEQGLRLDGEGRPIMSVVTTRDDGQDCAVFPGAATATEEEG